MFEDKAMTYNEIIRKKRDGGELDEAEINRIITGVISGDMPDHQLSAFLMATHFGSMTPKETKMLTSSMASSGDVLDLGEFGESSADMHGTGGLGDKTTLIVAPIVASLGGIVAQMSECRTLDKLESIPGYISKLSVYDFISQLRKTGIVIAGQCGSLAVASNKLSAISELTPPIKSAPQIASCIMSKKLATGARNILLDVKVEDETCIKSTAEAKELARTMISIGETHGRRVRAVITDANTPLGFAVGNVPELREAIDVLRGDGPDDVRETSVTLAGVLVSLVRNIQTKEGISLARECLASGAAYSKFKEWISAQGGDVRYITAPEMLGVAPVCASVKAKESGYIARMNAELIGRIGTMLGAGRRSGDTIDPLAGIILKKKTGDRVEPGDIIATLHTSSPELAAEGTRCFGSAFEITRKKPEVRSFILDII